MLLQDALQLLQEGKNLSRQAWDYDDGYLVMMQGMKHVWKIVLNPSPNAGNYIFSLSDLLADDWKEFQLLVDNEDEIDEE